MGRKHSIRGTSAETRVSFLLDQRLSAPAVAREMAREGVTLSESAIRRFAATRRSMMARAFAGEVTGLDVVARMIDAANAARVARVLAAEAGSPAALARSIQVESSILTKLSDLEIEPDSFAALHEEVAGFSGGLRRLVETRPEAAAALAAVLSEDPTTHDLSRSILAAISTPVQETAS